MKKYVFIFAIVAAFFTFKSVEASANNEVFGLGETLKTGTCVANGYPQSNLTDRTIFTDKNTATGVNISGGICVFKVFPDVKQISGFMFSPSGYNAELKLFNQDGIVISTITGPKKNYPAFNLLTTPINAYGFTLRNVMSTSSNTFTNEVQLYETPDTTKPAAPVLSGSQVSNKINLSWTKPNDIDISSYRVFRNDLQIAIVTGMNNTTYTDPNTTPGNYYYHVVAVDKSNNISDNSNIINLSLIDATNPSTVSNLESNAYDNEVFLTWSPATDNGTITGYKIFVNGSLVKTVTGTSTTINGLFNGVSYQFGVQTIDEAGNLSSTVFKTETPIDIFPPFQPEPTIGAITETTLEINWAFSTSVDIDYYEVQRSGQMFWNVVDHTGNINYNYTFTGLNSGTAYTLRVRAVDDDNNRSAIQAIQATTTTDPPATPSNLSVLPIDNQNNLNWDNNTETDLAGYKIYLIGSNTPLATVSTSDYIHSGIQNQVEKCYQVTAFDVFNNESNKSVPVCGTPVDIYPPFDVDNMQMTGTTEYSYTFSWTGSTSPDIDFYKIYQNNILKATQNHIPGQTTYTYTATGLTPGIVYVYKVNPVDDDLNELTTGTTGTINVSTISVPPTPPTNLNATPGEEKITFTWNEHPETDITVYKLYKVQGTNKTLIDSIPAGTTMYQLNTNNSTAFDYVLTAFDLGGAESNNSNIVNAAPIITAPKPPQPLFGGVTSPIAASDIVDSGFSLMNMLKWILLIGLAIWLASKLILRKQNIVKTISDPNKTETKQDQPQKIEKKKRRRRSKGLFGFIKDYYRDKKEKQKEEKKREKIKKERQRVTTLKKDLREKLSKSLGYKVYKK